MSANEVIDALGGTRALADALGQKISAVSNWRFRFGVPHRFRHVVIALAAERGLTITHADLDAAPARDVAA